MPGWDHPTQTVNWTIKLKLIDFLGDIREKYCSIQTLLQLHHRMRFRQVVVQLDLVTIGTIPAKQFGPGCLHSLNILDFIAWIVGHYCCEIFCLFRLLYHSYTNVPDKNNIFLYKLNFSYRKLWYIFKQRSLEFEPVESPWLTPYLSVPINFRLTNSGSVVPFWLTLAPSP